MSLVPEFELGVWNAWILILSYLLSFLVRYIFYRRKGQDVFSRPSTPPLNEKEKKSHKILQLFSLASGIYSFFLPLKLGTVWFYIGLFVYLLGMIINIIAGTTFMNTPMDRPATEGLYRISRNPIYLSTFLIDIGIGNAGASWIYLLYVMIEIILQNITVGAEERWCLEKYGDSYREYLKRTPRWLGIPS
ncbi:MAG: isoprenylcysteine carboxylmethyltransferase family protein [Candidatus Bathyarchaeota archaeon]|nr:MAG: isoprenylcysteine carboxylmethyltransferase family protein [Candidatus Bathyarchaeota archaeon]